MTTGIRSFLSERFSDDTKKLTDKQLSEFANFSGAGSGDLVTSFNKRLLNKGFIDNNTNYETSMGANVKSEGFQPNKNANSIMPAIAMQAIVNAKKMGIKNVAEFLANKDNIIRDKTHNQMVNDPMFKRMYPNAIQTIAQLYVDRNNEYKPTE